MTLTKKDILEMRTDSRLRIEKEFRKYRTEYMKEFLDAARKQQLKVGAEQIFEDAAAPSGGEDETASIGGTGY